MQPGSGVEVMEVEQDVPGSGVSLFYDEYQYEPLIAEDAVRVLIVEPADRFYSPLRCSITQHQRDPQSRSVSGCEYSAVSYTWGNSELSHQLLVRAEAQSWSRLRITASVDSLLRHFRAPHKARLFWIDAICLNQKDEIEKTQQIPLMGRIYTDAKRVRIWLGDDEIAKAQQAFAIIHGIVREYKPNVLKEEFLCLAEFFNRPWFTRRWVIQEAVFSHDAAFYCGIHKLGLSRVMVALGKIKRTGVLKWVGYGARMLSTSIGSRFVSVQGLLSLLWEFHEAECGDPRDRIAAVYALVTGSVRPSLQYDSRDWKDIYMDVASYYINNTPKLHRDKHASSAYAVLVHLCHFGSVESEADAACPSWIPNWSRRRKNFLPYGPDDQNLDKDDRVNHVFGQMSLKIIGKTLRLDYWNKNFFHQCGKVDQVIDSGPDFWHDVVVSGRSSLSGRLAQLLVKWDGAAGTNHADKNSLLSLLGRLVITWEKEKETGVLLRLTDPEFYSEQIRLALHEQRHDPEATTQWQRLTMGHVTDGLRDLSIIRIQASTRSYWAIGPSTARVGDWIVPLLIPQQQGFVPTLCLRPIHSERAEIKKWKRVSRAAGMEQRYLRFLGGSISKAHCLHVKARFVGPGGHCDGRSVPHNSKDNGIMWDIIQSTHKAAKDEGLPGPVVFDIV